VHILHEEEIEENISTKINVTAKKELGGSVTTRG